MVVAGGVITITDEPEVIVVGNGVMTITLGRLANGGTGIEVTEVAGGIDVT